MFLASKTALAAAGGLAVGFLALSVGLIPLAILFALGRLWTLEATFIRLAWVPAAVFAANVSVALRVKPDLVLLDARMPRSSGFEAARRLRTELPGVPVVFLTGIRDPQLAAEAFSAGATALI